MYDFKRIRSTCLLISLLVSVHFPMFAQVPDTSEVDTTGMIDFTMFIPSDPFIIDTPLVINLEFDIRQFTRTKMKGEYMPAILSYTNSEGHDIRKEVRIKARGEFRRQYCSFPPIKLSLTNDTTGNESLNDLKSVKLVTHCNNSETYEQYLLKELLIYRIYILMTECSYRVRLFIINYIDSQGKTKIHTHYGFIIESDKHLADRINSVKIEIKNLSEKKTDYQMYQLLAVFQFMVGNTDWSVPALHNIKLYKELNFRKECPVAIPFDFDYSGMVNAFYALPDEKLGTKTVRERVYRGYCIPEEDFIPVFQKFNEKKDALYSLVNNNVFLDKHHKNEMIAYLDEFFQILENQRFREALIVKSCRQL